MQAGRQLSCMYDGLLSHCPALAQSQQLSFLLTHDADSGARVGVGVEHGCVLHDWLVEGFEPEQNESDTEVPSERMHVTERVRVPPPHVSEHEPYEPVEYEYVYEGSGGELQKISSGFVLPAQLFSLTS